MADLVILDRIEDVEVPDYCIHGRATCLQCGAWVWLGSETAKVVTSREADPLCYPCASRLISPDARLMGRLHDHRRVDGPH